MYATNRIKIFQFCACLVLAAVGTIENRALAVDTPLQSTAYTRTVRGVEIRAVVPGQCRVNKPVLLSVELTNNSQRAVSWTEWVPDAVLNLNVVDALGKEVSLTQNGKALKKFPPFFRLVLQTLQPKETYSWNVNLADLFELRPGDCLVSVSIGLDSSEGKPIQLKLENMRLAVTPI